MVFLENLFESQNSHSPWFIIRQDLHKYYNLLVIIFEVHYIQFLPGALYGRVENSTQR